MIKTREKLVKEVEEAEKALDEAITSYLKVFGAYQEAKEALEKFDEERGE